MCIRDRDTDGSLAYHCMSDTLESSVRFLGNVWGDVYKRQRQGRYDTRNDTCRGDHIGKGIVVGKADATSCQKTGNADARNYE